MNHDYADITGQLGQPLWWDEHAVPRYCVFEPQKLANIYAREAALLEIACQNCSEPFKVAMSRSGFDFRFGELIPQALDGEIVEGSIHFCDPPNNGCCAAGPTMNCVDRRVLEFWVLDLEKTPHWRRRPELEVELDVSWSGKSA